MDPKTQPPVTSFALTRDRAYEILIRYIKNDKLIKHCLAAEAVMKAIYRKLYPITQTSLALDGKTLIPSPEVEHIAKTEEAKWGIVGLLHDADYELAKGNPEQHGLLLFFKEPHIPQDIAYAIKSHNYQFTNVLPNSKMDWAITCCDQLTGLIVAVTLVHPKKKLSEVTTDFVLKKYREKNFAKGADRTQIELCNEKLGIALPDFVELNLQAMQAISNDLGL